MKPFAFLIVVLLAGGCKILTGTDPNTGAPEKYIYLPPATAEKVEAVLKAGAEGAGAASVFWPIATPIATAFGAAYAVWRKNKGKLTAMQSETDALTNATTTLTDWIDFIKTEHQDLWQKVRAMLEAKLSKDAVARKAIDKARGRVTA